MSWVEKWAMIEVILNFLPLAVFLIFVIVIVVKVYTEDTYKGGKKK